MTPSLSVSIMAHRQREAYIPGLLAKLDRPAQVVWDRKGDRWDTGRRAWQAIDRAADYGLVLQDDAIIPRDLIAGVERALQHVPPDTPLCLYCGRNRPYRELVQQLVARAGPTTSWLTMAQCHWGVGIVLPTKWIGDMIAWADGRPDIANYDKRISRWLGHQGITTWYPWPSLADHRDSPSLVPGRGSAGRRAHRFVGADTSVLDLRWDGAVVSIPALNLTETATPRPRHTGGPPVLFVSLKYPNLDLGNKPGLHGIRFVNGQCEVTRPNAVSILQGMWWQRRGVRVATDEDLRMLAAAYPAPVEAAPNGAAPSAAETPPPAVAAESTPPQVPGGTAGDVLAWVGDDPERARQALDAEQGREKPRTSLVTKLERAAQPTQVEVAP